ncbi:MAG: ATPase domain-containing protein [Candidatus ainarchaeum sp.]|nr:ATPase domain-containing protein [Candidatus ainarchaeum sp.]
MVNRIATGINGFDELIEGGLPQGSLTLVSGNPGTGKSIFCMQAAYNVAAKGKLALYVSFEQTEKILEEQLTQFGLDIKKLNGKLKLLFLDPNDPDVMSTIQKEAKKINSEFIVVDSLASLTSGPSNQSANFTAQQIMDSVIPVPIDSENLARMKVKLILDTIRNTKATAMLTSEIIHGQDGYSRDTLSEFLCDAIIVLHSVEGEEGFRTLTIPKIRLTKQKSGIYSFEMTKKGIIVKSSE